MKTSKAKSPSRAINGILLIDKPKGMTSNAALQHIKRLFHAKKAGHTGSLDPIADGMLPICLGEATKFSQYLLNADKTYAVKADLGARTTTGDSEGEIISQKPVPTLTRRQLEKFLSPFRGEISQVPPMYSALKYKGQPLYQLARQGVEVPRNSRQVTIDELSILDWRDNILELYVHCTKGTYIRTLIDDLGEAIGCGAHVVALRRLSVGHYETSQMVSVACLEKQYDEKSFSGIDCYILPIESIVAHFPTIKLSKMTTFYMRHGHPVMVPHAPTSGLVHLRTNDNDFMGIGEILNDGKVAPRRLLKS